jgi:hypothetical protein
VSTLDDGDALGIVQDPNVTSSALRGKFGATETPPAYPGADNWAAIVEKIDALAREVVNTTQPDPPSGVASGTADANGNCFLVIYTVSMGEQFRLHRAVLEAQGFSPASPYAASTAWVGFYALDAVATPTTYVGINDTLQGALKDLGPMASGGPIFPGVWTDSAPQGAEIRGPRALCLVVVGTAALANKRITVNWQGTLRRARGIT